VRRTPPKAGSASDAWRKASEGDRDRGVPAAHEPDRWVDEGPVRNEASAAVARGEAAPAKKAPPKRIRSKKGLPQDVIADVTKVAGPLWAARVQDRLAEATEAYGAERFRDAKRVLEPLLERVPGAIPVRELYGLTLYRMGRWRDASRELGAVELLTGSVEHHPVIADCQRALGNLTEVRRLWDELRQEGVGAEILVEGRIVMAGALADAGDVVGAVRLLEEGPVEVKNPKEHHLRLWYALAALHERAGDPTRARGLFTRLVRAEPTFADAAERLQSLGG
jgi:tetratricopeptide (TPR) repeat protein